MAENPHTEEALRLTDVAIRETSTAADVLARAQVEALLAVAYEQRTANLLAVQQATAEGLDAATKHIRDAIQKAALRALEPNADQERAMEAAAEALEAQAKGLKALGQEVRARVGLESWDEKAAEILEEFGL